MCSAPKVNIPQPKAAPAPPAVIEQVAPVRRADKSAAGRRAGTKKYRAGSPGLTIGGVSGSSSGVGIGK